MAKNYMADVAWRWVKNLKLIVQIQFANFLKMDYFSDVVELGCVPIVI